MRNETKINNAVRSRRVAALLLAATACAAAFASSAGARFDGNPCVTARLTKALVVKVKPMVGPDTTTMLDSGHKNECDLFSGSTGREVRVYIWPKSQKASAVSEIVNGTYSGRKVKTVALSGLGPGATSYNGDPSFVAGNEFFVLFPYGLSPIQALKVARIIYAQFP